MIDPKDYSPKQLRLFLACNAPADEIDGMIGPSVKHAAAFLGVQPEDYNANSDYLKCAVKARFMWADAMIAEANK